MRRTPPKHEPFPHCFVALSLARMRSIEPLVPGGAVRDPFHDDADAVPEINLSSVHVPQTLTIAKNDLTRAAKSEHTFIVKL